MVGAALIATFSMDVLELLLGREDLELLEVWADEDDVLLDALFLHSWELGLLVRDEPEVGRFGWSLKCTLAISVGDSRIAGKLSWTMKCFVS